MEISPKRAQNPIPHQNIARAPGSLLEIHRDHGSSSWPCPDTPTIHTALKAPGPEVGPTNFKNPMDLFFFPTSAIFLSHYSIVSGSLLQVSWSPCTGGGSEKSIAIHPLCGFHRSIPHSHGKIPMKVCPCLLLVCASAYQQENQPRSHVPIFMPFYVILMSFFNPIPSNCREQLDLQHWSIQAWFFSGLTLLNSLKLSIQIIILLF